VLATFPINVVAGTIQQQEQMGIGQKTSKDFDSNHANSLIATAFTNMRTVSAFSMHFKVIEEYTASTLRMSMGRRKVMGWAGVYFGISNGITFSTYAFLFYIGSTLIKANEIDFEQMMRALFCIMFGAMGMGAALADVGDQTLGLQAADRIFDAIKAAEDAYKPARRSNMAGVEEGAEKINFPATLSTAGLLTRSLEAMTRRATGPKVGVELTRIMQSPDELAAILERTAPKYGPLRKSMGRFSPAAGAAAGSAQIQE
jgi:hypothetical protein